MTDPTPCDNLRQPTPKRPVWRAQGSGESPLGDPAAPARTASAARRATAPELGSPPQPVDCFVEGRPVPEPRPRFTRSGRTYVPSSADGWKDDVRAAWVLAAGRPVPGVLPTRRPASVSLEFRFRRPASHYTPAKLSATLRASTPVRHTQRPDLDNLAKAVMDALGGWGDLPPLAWVDDSQVIALAATKRWVGRNDPEGVHVSVRYT